MSVTPDIGEIDKSLGWSPPDDISDIDKAIGWKPPKVAPSGTWWTPDRVNYAVDHLQKNAGLSRVGALGLVSRWAGVEAKNGPSSVNPVSGATGIGQWLGTRKNGVPTDFDGQLDHAARELNTTESAAAKRLRTAQNPQDAAIGASMYERAEGYDPKTGRDNFVAPTMQTMRTFGGQPTSAIDKAIGWSPNQDVSDIDKAIGWTPPTPAQTAVQPPTIPGSGPTNPSTVFLPPTQTSPVPERPDTIQAQIDAASDPNVKARAAVLTTDPSQNALFGNRSDFVMIPTPNGNLWVNKDKAKKLKLRTPEQIGQFIDKNPVAVQRLTGTAEDVGNNTNTGDAVLTTDSTGKEVSAKIVTNPQSAGAQIALDKNSFPNSQSQIVPAQAVAQRRQFDPKEFAKANAYLKSQGQPAITKEQYLEAQTSGSVGTSVNPGDFKIDGAPVTDFAQGETTPGGGQILRQAGLDVPHAKTSDDLAATYQTNQNQSEEDAFRDANQSAAAKYGATINVDDTIKKLKAAGQPLFVGGYKPGGQINVTEGDLINLGADPSLFNQNRAQMRSENPQVRTDLASTGAAKQLPTFSEFIRQAPSELPESVQKALFSRDQNNQLTDSAKASQAYLAYSPEYDKQIGEGIKQALLQMDMPDFAVPGVSSYGGTTGKAAIGSFVSDMMQFGGGLMDYSVPGIINDFVTGQDLGAPLAQFGNRVEKINEVSTPDTKVYKLAALPGDVIGKLPGYALATAAAGGNPILGFALHDALVARGKTGSDASALGAAAQGALMGGALGPLKSLGEMAANGLLGEGIASAVKGVDDPTATAFRTLVEKGVPVGLATGLGYGQSAALGGTPEENAKNALLFASMEFAGSMLHKAPGESLTPEDVAKVDGTIIRVPDENDKPVTVALSDKDGQLQVTKVDAPPVNGIVLPKKMAEANARAKAAGIPVPDKTINAEPADEETKPVETNGELPPHLQALIPKLQKRMDEAPAVFQDVTPAGYGPDEPSGESYYRDPNYRASAEENKVQASINKAKTLLKGNLSDEKRAQIQSGLESSQRKLAELQKNLPPEQPSAEQIDRPYGGVLEPPVTPESEFQGLSRGEKEAVIKESGNGVEQSDVPASARTKDKSATPTGIAQVPTSDLSLDPDRFQYNPDRFQYKTENRDAQGSTGSLKGVKNWNPNFAGLIQVWRDPADGKDYVVNGHNRYNKAVELGQKNVNVQYIDAPDEVSARAIGALSNIADGKGTPLDAAQYLKDSGKTIDALRKQGIPLENDVAKKGIALSKLNDFVFNAVRRGELPESQGVAIGNKIESPDLQDQAYKALAKAGEKKPLTQAVTSEILDAIDGAPRETNTEQSLFGDFETSKSLFAERAQAAAAIKQKLSGDKTLFGLATRKSDRLAEGGTTVDVEQAKELRNTADEALRAFDTLKNRSGEISDILDSGAKAIANGESPDRVARSNYERIRQAVKSAIKGGDTERSVSSAEASKPSESETRQPTLGEVANDQAKVAESNASTAPSERETKSQPETKPDVATETQPETKSKPDTRGLTQTELATAFNRFSKSGDLSNYRRKFRTLSTDEKIRVAENLRAGDDPDTALKDAKGFNKPDFEVGDHVRRDGIVGKVYERGGQLRVKYEGENGPQSVVASGDWKKTANPQAGSVDPTLLTLGLNRTLQDDVAPSLKKAGRGLVGAVDDIRKLVFAGGRGESAKLAGTSLRAETGKMARSALIAENALKDARKYFSKNPVEDNYDFISHMESGDVSTLPPDEQLAARSLRNLLDESRDRVQALGTGKLENYIENYFPHIWDDPKKASSVFSALTKKPFEGSKAFLKKRVYNTFQEGLDAGLRPVSDNPVDLTLLKIRDMDKYVAAHNTINYLKDNGLATFVRMGQKAPDGFIKIDDRISEIKYQNDKGELVTAGNLYAAEPAATIINNYLSPGLTGSKYGMIRDGYKAWRWAGNVLNQAQLGLSAFHAMFTTIDAATSKLALGINQLADRRPLEAAKSIAELPVSPITNLLRGNKIMKEGLNPGSTDENTRILADAVAEAGGRFKTDDFYRTKAAQKMTDAFRRGNILGGIMRVPTGALDIASRPLMEYLVPRQKLGVFADMAKNTLERLGPDATVEQKREALAKDWDSVDNRMGQLVYDNLFWNKTIKDLSMASVRSVGWNLGDVRELGGAVKDAVMLPARIKRAYREGKQVEPIVTRRMAYAAALPVVAGTIGATMQYLFTGKGPEEMKDYFFPKTGNFDENGNPERLSLPTYIKDIYAYQKHPGKTLQNKLHPLIGIVADMLQNKDYYGTEIRHSDDPLIQQLTDEAKFVGKQATPFSVQGLLKEKERQGSGASKALSFFGFNPAPKDINNTKAEDLLAEIQASRADYGTRTKAQAAKKQEIADLVRMKKRGESIDDAFSQAKQAGVLDDRDRSTITKRANSTYLEEGFSRLTLDDGIKVYDAATTEERTRLKKEMQTKIRNASKKGLTPGIKEKLASLGLNNAQ